MQTRSRRPVAMANLSAEDLQKRLLRIGQAAKARNPDGFVDEIKRRRGGARDDDVAAAAAAPAPSVAAQTWFVLEPESRLERALARGDVPRPSGNGAHWSWLCYDLQEDGTSSQTLQKSAATVLARPRSAGIAGTATER